MGEGIVNFSYHCGDNNTYGQGLRSRNDGWVVRGGGAQVRFRALESEGARA